MLKNTVWMFPGQSAQKKGMGKNLFGKFPKLLEKANHILGYPLEKLCLTDPDQQLNQTQFTQPALFVVNTLKYLEYYYGMGDTPQWVVGHSLGEYNALFAANVFDFETGLKLVIKRAQLMASIKGKMAAVTGLTSDTIQSVLEANFDSSYLEIANSNAPTQFVLSGPETHIYTAQSAFEAAGCDMYIPLKVSGPFHSSWMQPIAEAFSDYLMPLKLNNPSIKVISNVTAQPYTDQADIKTALVAQLYKPVRWTDTINTLQSNNVSTFKELNDGRPTLEKLLRSKTALTESPG